MYSICAIISLENLYNITNRDGLWGKSKGVFTGVRRHICL